MFVCGAAVGEAAGVSVADEAAVVCGESVGCEVGSCSLGVGSVYSAGIYVYECAAAAEGCSAVYEA